MKELRIDNKPIIPVRLIPFVTGWKLSPDVVVKILAKSDKWNRVYIPSFHLSADNTYQPMLPKEWDVFNDDLEILSDTLHAGDKVEGESYPTWRKRSIEVIPGSTFVWLDDLKKTYETVNSRIIFTEERPGDRELNLQPYMTPEERKLVFEGFDNESETHNHTNFLPQQNQPQDINISFNELHHYMQLDSYYGNNSIATLSIINGLYNTNSDNDLFQRFDKRFSQLPCKGDQVRHLIYYWCGLMQLPTYLNGSPTNWQREDFLDNWMKDFDLNLGELKNFLRANSWPLPVKVFPNETDNTQNKVSLDEAEFEHAFNDFSVILPKLKYELAELLNIQPENIEALKYKKTEIERLEQQIAEIMGTSDINHKRTANNSGHKPNTNERDVALQQSANTLAEQWKQANRRVNITKREIAKALAVSDEWNCMTADRIERIILKQW